MGTEEKQLLHSKTLSAEAPLFSSSAVSSTTLLSTGFLFFVRLRIVHFLYELCLPPNTAAIASHRPGFLTGCFAISFFRITRSPSLHSFSNTMPYLFSCPQTPIFLASRFGNLTTGATTAATDWTSSDLRDLERH
ncbi:hypothetical protein PIB30_023853 [Stylosanthes scabra]|uniref:Uncharacterized protein n=1 Tax=Stylosanthes scabra TaxID=79078 RepID=A0ABU6R9T2_9FABA|nr:hypothetical protein [Stylosanthes scabra]